MFSGFKGKNARLFPMLWGALVTFGLLATEIFNPNSFERVGNLVFDSYQKAAPREQPELPIKIVLIDDLALEKLGQFPWPRTVMAELIEQLAAVGAATVALDIVFSEPDRTSPNEMKQLYLRQGLSEEQLSQISALQDHDVLLSKSFKKIRVVGGFFLNNSDNGAKPPVRHGPFSYSGSQQTPIPYGAIKNYSGAVVSQKIIDKRLAGAGFLTIQKSGVQREVPLIARIGEEVYPSLSLEALRISMRAKNKGTIKSTAGSGKYGSRGRDAIAEIKIGKIIIPTTPRGALRLHYATLGSNEQISAWHLLDPNADKAALKKKFDGALVFVGASATGLRDNVSIPIQDTSVPGVTVHAQAAAQMLTQSFLQRPDWINGVEMAVLLVAGILIALTQNFLGSLKGGILAAFLLAGIAYLSWHLFKVEGLLFDPTYPILGTIAVFLVTSVSDFYLTEGEKAQIKGAFNLYLSPEMVDRIADDPALLELGGEDRELSIMFCDVRNFSRTSEKLGPKRTTEYLNAYLTPMTDILLDSDATIDKFIGDAILSFWNAPLDVADHPKAAAKAALLMINTLKEMNDLRVSDPDKAPLEVHTEIGIGLGCGECTVGNMGSDQRFAYSVIGDTVNLASRLEGITKQYKVPIVMGDIITDRLPDFATLELDVIKVVGRKAPVRIAALLGDEAMAVKSEFHQLRQTQAAFLKAYRAQDWAGAARIIEQTKTAKQFGISDYYEMMRGRMIDFTKTPPGQDWDGVFKATEK